MNKKELQKAQNIIDVLFYDDKVLTQWQHTLLENVISIAQTKLRQPPVSGNEVALPFDKVTRLEVISYREGDKSGRVFTHWKDDNKIEGQLQDKDRTLKIFIDKR